MGLLLVIGILGFVAGAVYFGLIVPAHILERRRKTNKEAKMAKLRELLQKGFPRPWREHLSRNWIIYRSLPLKTKTQLHKKIGAFLTSKTFKGKRGLSVTEEMRLLIAAQASLLVLSRRDCYPHLSTVEVYPSSLQENIAGTSSMSLYREGVIRISWEAADYGARLRSDAYNVVIHECAHQLDQIDLLADGIPDLPPKLRRDGWIDSFKQAYSQFLSEPQAVEIIADYGRTDLAEFFACGTEAFFERPEKLRRHYKPLYTLLQQFYCLDPAVLYNQKKGNLK